MVELYPFSCYQYFKVQQQEVRARNSRREPLYDVSILQLWPKSCCQNSRVIPIIKFFNNKVL